MLFGCALLTGFVEGFVFTWDEVEFEVVECAFNIKTESYRKWAIGERNVVVERVVKVVAAREYGLPFIN